MSDVIKTLTEHRNKVWGETMELAERAASENRDFSGEEQTKYDALNGELSKIDARAKEIKDGIEAARAAEDAYAELRKGATETPETRTESENFRAFLRGDAGRKFEVNAAPVNYRDLVKGTATAGGNTVPTSFYGKLVEHMTENAAILRSGATVLNTASGEELQIPKTTAHASAAAIVAEGAALSDNDPTFGQVSLRSFKYGFKESVSPELLTDTGVALEGYLARRAGVALGNGFGAHAVTGDGSSKPRGLLLDASAGVTGPTGVTGGFGTQSTAGQGGDLFIDLYHSVIEPYRNSAACHWMMNDSTAAKVRKLKNSQGDYIWQPGLVAGAPDTILGKPVLIEPNMPNTGLGLESVLFGDFAAYFVRLVGGIRWERSDDYEFGNDLITFRALMRADAAMVDLTGALKTFTGGAS